MCARYVDEPKGTPERSWLHEVLKDKTEVKNVVVFPGCCGTYEKGYQALIVELFPQIKWTFVDVRDLFDNINNHADWVASAFLEAGILRVE